MKDCEEIDKRIATLGGCDEYCCATLTDGSKIIFRTSDNFYARFLSSCCATTSENIFSDCESFSENFLILHPEDIVEIDYIAFNQIEEMLETDSSFKYIEDDTYYGIEDNLVDFLRNGGTVCVKGNPVKSFGESRVLNYGQALNLQNAVSHQAQAPVQRIPTVSCGKPYPSTPTITGRSRRVL